MAQSKVAKKSGRHHRNNRSERPQSTSTPQHQEYPLVISSRSDSTQHAGSSVPALLTGPHTDAPAQIERNPAPLALIPQPVAAKAAHAQKRRHAAMIGALLVSVCLIAAAIFSFGTSKENRDDMPMAQSSSNALPITAASDAGKDEHAAKGTPPSEKRPVATRAKRADAKSTAVASKSGSATPRTEKKIAQARSKPDTPRGADNATKKPASAIAKAPNNAPDDKRMPLLAQNGASPGSKSARAPDSYAQCQDLDSFFRREQCKWQVCNGKWGQDGCPSYADDNRVFN